MMSSVTSSSAPKAGRSVKRHKSGAHHRAKTARKKKKQWAQFSRWGPDVENDNDDEFVQFCQSRGLTRATTAPPFRNNTVTLNLINKDARQKRYGTAYTATHKTKPEVEEASNPPVVKPDDSVYISRLCSSLKDKRKFVLDSERQSASHVEDKKSTETKSQNSVEKMTPEKQKEVKNEPEVIKIPIHMPERETTNENVNEKTSLLPAIVTTDSPPSKSTSPVSCQSIGNFSSIIRSSNDVHKHLSQRRPTREWTAEVENEIMKLYESGGPGSVLNTMNSKPLPRALVNVKEQMETKISNADHTPSYVLALANLFRRRMQIRKEFSQVAGEIMTSSLKTAPISYSSNNAFPTHKAKNMSQSKYESPQPVSLRYHHVVSDVETSSVQTPTQTNVDTTNPNISFCSISTPIVTSTQYATSQTKVEGEKDIGLEINTKPAKSSVESLIKEKLDNAPKFTLLLPFEGGNKPKTEALDNLLTVFPKPPQFKYASLNTGGENILDTTKEINNKIVKSIINSKPLAGANELNATVPSSSLVASFTKSIKRNTIHNNPHRNTFPKSMPNPQEKLDIKIQPTSKRKCRSANLSNINEDDIRSGDTHDNFKPSRISKPRLLREVILLNKHTSQADDVNMSLVPMSKVRWTGSLGTLYKKTNPDIGRTILDSIAPELDNLTTGLNDNHLHRKAARPQVSTNQVQTDLMAVSPG